MRGAVFSLSCRLPVGRIVGGAETPRGGIVDESEEHGRAREPVGARPLAVSVVADEHRGRVILWAGGGRAERTQQLVYLRLPPRQERPPFGGVKFSPPRLE